MPSEINVGDYVVVKDLGYRPSSLYVVTEISGNTLLMWYTYDRDLDTLQNKNIDYMVSKVEHAPLDLYLEYLKAKQNAKI